MSHSDKVRFRVSLYLLYAAPLIMFGLFFLGNVMRHYLQPFPYAEAYSHAQYLFDYRDWGFVKRGLIATLFPQTPASVADFAAWFGVAVGLLVIAVSTGLIWLSRVPVVLMLLMCSPFFVYQLGYILGRLDCVGILFFVTWLMARQTGQARLADALYVSAPILIFVHEVFLLTVLSAMFMIQNIERFEWRRNLLITFHGLVALGIVMVFGKLEAGQDEMQAYFQHYFGIDNLTQYVLSWGVNDSLVMTHGRHLANFGPHSAVTLAVFAVAVVVYGLVFSVATRWVFWLSTLGFATVFVMGHDWGRWVALYISLVGIGLTTCRPVPPGLVIWAERLMIPILIISVLATPANITRLFIEWIFFARDQNFERLLN